MAQHIVILGAGITGLTTALALRKHSPEPKPAITIIEIRPTPSTIGGAVNLTPKALRYLDHVGVYEKLLSKRAGEVCRKIELFSLYSGAKSCEIDFRGSDGAGIGKDGKKYFARRVLRWQLQEALLETVQMQNDNRVLFGKKVIKIEENLNEGVRLSFEDGKAIKGDLLLGCDGIHSACRSLLVEPSRQPYYTGISGVMAISKIRPGTQLRWETTGLVSSRRGSFMASYFEEARQEQFIAVVMEIADVASREGWKIRGSDQQAIKGDIKDRFQHDAVPELEQLTEDAGEWTLYPVYMLGPGGKWASPGGRCILLGDAAHAMAPQGESTGICIEDAIVFSRAMKHQNGNPLDAVFKAYEQFRRPHIDKAYETANWRWETVKDSGWLAYHMKWFLTPWFIWWTAKAREEEFAQDYSDLDLQIHF